MNSVEKNGCRVILRKLSKEDVFSLVDTVCKKQIKVTDVTEAIKAIITFTANPADLLKRKKIKRDILFQYLTQQQMRIPEPDDKVTLIMQIMKHWESAVDQSQLKKDMAKETSVSPSTSSSSLRGASSFTSVSEQGQPSIATNVADQSSRKSPSSVSKQRQPSSATNAAAQAPMTVHVHQTYNVTNIHTPPTQPQTVSQTTPETQTMSQSTKDPELQKLAEAFTKWFYENLNSHNPSMEGAPKDFTPQNFWDDAKLVINIHTPAFQEEKFSGHTVITQRFLNFTRDDQLLFNANIASGGIYVKSSPHGLVQILVCGTVHRRNDCLGIFQQTFGIIRDPRYDNNWKIKVSKLDMKTSQVTAMPMLEGNLDEQINAILP